MECIKKINELISNFKSKKHSLIEKIVEECCLLENACSKIAESWSGSFLGWHSSMYYEDFTSPPLNNRFSGEWGAYHGIPAGWHKKSVEEVTIAIQKAISRKKSLESLEQEIAGLRNEIKDLHNEVVIVLSAINLDENYSKEKGILKEIEQYKFDSIKGKYIDSRMPKTLVSRDIEALRQGKILPTHLYYEGVANDGESLAESIEQFCKLCIRLCRQIELKQSSSEPITDLVNVGQLKDLHNDIYLKCKDLFIQKSYPEAVEKGFKVVRDRLRKLTGHETGSEAFGKGKLYVEGASAPNVDEDFNEAVKFLTMAIDRFRNEKSHTSDAKIEDPIRAYEYLRLSSLAMNLLEKARIKG